MERKVIMKMCSIPGCDRKHAANGVCLMHYKRFRRYGSYDLPTKQVQLCEHCNREVEARGLCSAHYQMWKRHKDPLHADKKRAELEPVFVDKQGYWATRGSGRNNVHRAIANALPGQIVHHVDGDKLNNGIDNLYLCDDHAKHLLCHRSLETIGFEFVRAGLITFNRSSGTYELADQAIGLLEQLQHSLTGDT